VPLFEFAANRQKTESNGRISDFFLSCDEISGQQCSASKETLVRAGGSSDTGVCDVCENAQTRPIPHSLKIYDDFNAVIVQLAA
jgi:hypothetical protein